MDIQRAVKDFVLRGQGLYHRLRMEGDSLSDLDLVTLREQLHLLDAEAAALQDRKDFESDGITFIFGHRRPQPAKQLTRRRAA
jgi:hypothetical protein